MVYGPVPDVSEGRIFPNRRSLFEAGVHRDIQRGITGRRNELGAESVVLSHGYEDDADFGDLIFYTGDGGRDQTSLRQVADQKMTGRNLTLAKNVDTGTPVRVVRSVSGGYRYDGLYLVEEAWVSPGQSGFLVCRFRLRHARGDTSSSAAPTHLAPGVGRRASTLYRLVRDTEIATRVKAIHEFRCQVCGIRLETAAGPYAEAAHVLPLGSGYDGPDVPENVLCLCPNDHLRLDHGAVFILDDLTIMDAQGTKLGKLRTRAQHALDVRYFRSHRAIFGRL
jgi:putative restriction endonuclease